jgi:hypothetical protein
MGGADGEGSGQGDRLMRYALAFLTGIGLMFAIAWRCR